MTTPAPRPELPTPYAWTGRAASGFVLATLLMLVVVPILVQRRVTELRARIEASEPARTLVARLHYHFATEVAPAGGPVPGRAGYQGALAAEQAIHRELAPLARRLSPGVARRYESMVALADRWHDHRALDDPPIDRPEDFRLFQELLAANEELDRAILSMTAGVRGRIEAAERLGLRVTVLLALLAMVAAGIVARLEARVRRSAAEAERRRVEAEQKRREAEAAVAETARANEARARLLRGVSHDVKNPLGAARGYAELLAMGIKAPVHPEQVPLLEGVRRSVDSALAILADLLDIARADSGGLSMRCIRIDLWALLAEAVQDHRGAAEAAGHRLERGEGASLAVLTDPARVRQVLDNLLTNAVKYTLPAGRITVGLEPDGALVRVHVDDTGPGIPAEQREAVFDEFARLDERSPAKGHGLGLAIARRIARLLGGDLTAAEAPGGGARFTLSLPAAPSR